jgi:hypothetical protein
MHRVRLLVLLSGVLLVASLSHAQTATGETLMLDLPRQSQHALVMQRIGITDITVNYHRPLADGRQIWGKLVPYGQVWRAGANENTTITFSDPVTIEGQALDKGTYGLHMIPGENQWTVIFSKNSTSWGSFTYKQEEDALRVNVKPQAAELHDALAYDFDDVKPDSAVVTMRWDKVAVPFKVEVKVNDIVTASIHRQMHGLNQYYWEGWDDAAGYFLANKINLDEALKDEDSRFRRKNGLTTCSANRGFSRRWAVRTTPRRSKTRCWRRLTLCNSILMPVNCRWRRSKTRLWRSTGPVRRSFRMTGHRTWDWLGSTARREILTAQ